MYMYTHHLIATCYVIFLGKWKVTAPDKNHIGSILLSSPLTTTRRLPDNEERSNAFTLKVVSGFLNDAVSTGRQQEILSGRKLVLRHCKANIRIRPRPDPVQVCVIWKIYLEMNAPWTCLLAFLFPYAKLTVLKYTWRSIYSGAVGNFTQRTRCLTFFFLICEIAVGTDTKLSLMASTVNLIFP